MLGLRCFPILVNHHDKEDIIEIEATDRKGHPLNPLASSSPKRGYSGRRMSSSTSNRWTGDSERIRQGTIELVLYSEVVLPLPVPSSITKTTKPQVGNQAGRAVGEVPKKDDEPGDGINKPEEAMDGATDLGLSGLSIQAEGNKIDESSALGVESEAVRDGIPGGDGKEQHASGEERTVWARYLDCKEELRERSIESM